MIEAGEVGTTRRATIGVLSDEELYAAWSAGDRVAGARLIDRHLGTVTRFFANKTASAPDLEDLVAATFERCAKSLGGFRGEGSFRAYLLAIARYQLLDHLRIKRPDEQLGSQSLADLQPSPSTLVARHAEVTRLLEALRAIPLELQLALELHFFEDLSREEAAQVLGIPAGTLASRIRRGKELLGREVAARGGSPTALDEDDLASWLHEIRGLLGLADPS